jgi:hypothetical protein
VAAESLQGWLRGDLRVAGSGAMYSGTGGSRTTHHAPRTTRDRRPNACVRGVRRDIG